MNGRPNKVRNLFLSFLCLFGHLVDLTVVPSQCVKTKTVRSVRDDHEGDKLTDSLKEFTSTVY